MSCFVFRGNVWRLQKELVLNARRAKGIVKGVWPRFRSVKPPQAPLSDRKLLQGGSGDYRPKNHKRHELSILLQKIRKKV